jgi:hypothetical protein
MEEIGTLEILVKKSWSITKYRYCGQEDLLGLGLDGKGKRMSEKKMFLIAHKESYRTMFRSFKKQLQDTELGTGSGTNRHTYTYVRYGRVQ